MYRIFPSNTLKAISKKKLNIKTNSGRISKVISTFAVFLLLFSANPISATTAEDARLAEIARQKAVSTQKVGELQGQINTIQSQINELNAKILVSADKINTLRINIENNKNELIRQNSFLREYLKSIYFEDQTSTLEMLASSNSLSEYIDKNQYLQSIQENIQKTKDKITATKAQLELDKQAAEVEKGTLETMEVQQIALRNGVAWQKGEQENIVASLSSEEKKIRQAQADRIKRGSNGVRPVSFCEGGGRVIPASSQAIFAFPVKCGYISQGFGMTEFASGWRDGGTYYPPAYNGAIHNGIDVAVAQGTAIGSIGEGTVTDVGYQGAWGYYATVEHPNGMASFYAHMNGPALVSVGQAVSTGTTVGGVGGSGGWPVHLHFSIYTSASDAGNYPGSTVDPLRYMDTIISTIGTDWDPNYRH